MKTLATFVLALMMFSVCGCQTFTLSHEQFKAQQMGKADDSPESKAVAVGGTAGYWAGALAQILAK